MRKMLGKMVTVTVDRPMGTYHPVHRDLYYAVNYGYIEGVFAPDGEEQDAYILGIDRPVESFTGRVTAIIHRKNDVEDKLVVTSENQHLSENEIVEQTHFQEKFFDIEIIM